VQTLNTDQSINQRRGFLYSGRSRSENFGSFWRRPGQHVYLPAHLSFNPATRLHSAPSQKLWRDPTGWWPLEFNIFLVSNVSSLGNFYWGLKNSNNNVISRRWVHCHENSVELVTVVMSTVTSYSTDRLENYYVDEQRSTTNTLTLSDRKKQPAYSTTCQEGDQSRASNVPMADFEDDVRVWITYTLSIVLVVAVINTLSPTVAKCVQL